jgi:hypothetical protein
MTIPTNAKHADYARFAYHCLTAEGSDQDACNIQREMALEWLRLADAIILPLNAHAVLPLRSP